MPGPVAKRDAERRRRNKDVVETIVVDVDELLAGEIEIPAPPRHFVRYDDEKHGDRIDEVVIGPDGKTGFWESSWHPFAENAYLSLARSGQVVFFEPSDWATAYVLCEMISRELKAKPIVVQVGEGETEIQWVISPVNGAVMGAFLKGWASLMATEGDRRRLKIELERKKARDEAASAASGGNVTSITKSREEALA